MGKFAVVKQLALSVRLYRPARALHRAFSPLESRNAREHRSLLSQFVRPGDLVFDVGANVGNKTEILLALGARVVAFEPQPMCCREVAARGNKRLIVVSKAVGAKEGTAQLYLTSADAVASLLPDWKRPDNLGTITVPVTTLDNAIDEFGVPTFCKIDVEGFELEVLKGLSRPISIISLEYHTEPRDIQAVYDCMSILAERRGKGNYTVNLTGQEGALFLSPRWLTIEEFKDLFLGARRKMCGETYSFALRNLQASFVAVTS